MKSERRGKFKKLKGKALIFVILFATLAFVSVGCTSAATHYVNPGDLIQDAVDAANSGDIIIVRDGTYTENINVYRRLTIQSENGAASTIVQAANPDDHVFEVTADWVNITGFTATGATTLMTPWIWKAGFYLSLDVNHCNISYNTALANHCGVYLFGSNSNNIITNNTVNSNNHYGIYLYYSSSNEIISNTANDNNFGIYLDYPCSNNVISGNIATDNAFHGVVMESSSNNILADNTINGNQKYGIWLRDSSNNEIISNIVNGNINCGIYIQSSSNFNRIYNNYFNNTNNTHDDGNNIWNITKIGGTNIVGGSWLGGNYWSDYAGTDADGDGLGDTPYDIPGGMNKDYLPLVEITPKPAVTVSTDKYEYSAGDTMIVTIGFKNPTASSVSTYFVWYFGLPSYGYWTQILATPLTLPPNFDQSYNISIPVGNWGSVGFDATWYVALLEPTPPYKTISEDTANWKYNPRAKTQEGKVVPEAIAKEITKEIEGVEFAA